MLPELMQAVHAPVVLLVDDSAMVAETLQRLLGEEPDITFHYCSEPGEAVAMAAQLRPTVILQDLVMPEVDGLTLVRQYRQHQILHDTPVIVLSAKEKAHDKGEAFAAGANDYLVKLPDKIELLARIRYHSKAYSNQLQRDEAYRALHESQIRLEEKNRELQRLYSVDGLTGIANRRYFDETFEREWRRGARDKSMLSLIMIDIDCFKGYNDHYGHQAGDDCLRRVAAMIGGVLKRPADLAARYGGEEFVVMLPDTHGEGAGLVGEMLRLIVDNACITHANSNVADHVTISAGTATIVPVPNFAPGILIAAADKALYQAKREGRNQVKQARS